MGSVSIKLITPQGDSLEEFLVVSKGAKISHSIVLGMNLMGSANINFQNRTLRLKGSQKSKKKPEEVTDLRERKLK